MFNIGPQELLLILVLALLVVGPKRLPEIARSVGKGVRELRRAQDEVRKTVQVSLEEPAPRDSDRSGRRLPVDTQNEPAASTPSRASDEDAADATVGDTPPAATGSDAAAPAAASGVSEVSRTLGRTLAELRRAREEVQRSFRVDLDPMAGRPRRTPPVAPTRDERVTTADVTDATPGEPSERSAAVERTPNDGPAAGDPERRS